MSDCKKFGNYDIQDKSPEERLAILESKFPVLIERIQSYDKVIDENIILKYKLSELLLDCQRNEQIIKDLNSSFENHKKAQENKFVGLSNSNVTQNSALRNLIDCHNSLDKRVDGLKDQQVQDVGEITRKHCELANLVPSKKDVDYVKDRSEVLIKTLSQNLEDQKKQIDYLGFSVKNYFTKQDNFQTSLDLSSSEISSLKTSVSSLSKSIDDSQQKLLNIVRFNLSSFDDAMEKRIEDATNKLVPIGVS